MITSQPYDSSVSPARTNIGQAFKFIGWRNAASRISYPGIQWMIGPERDCFVGSNGWVWFASKDHPSWIISSCGFESSWYPLDVTRTSCSKLQLPNLLVTDGSMVKTMSR